MAPDPVSMAKFAPPLLSPAVKAYKWLSRWVRAGFVSRAGGTHFTVLVADLGGDDANVSVTKRVAQALNVGQRGVHTILLGRPLSFPDLGNQREAERQVAETASRWLEEKEADVLVFGQVAGDKLRLWLTTGEGTEPAPLEERPNLEMPPDFDERFQAALVAVTMSAIGPVMEQRGRYIAGLLLPVATKLENLLVSTPPGTTPEQGAALWHALGLAAAVIGEQRGDGAWLNKAVTAFREALRVRPRERAPLGWAMTQNNLGNALRALGERESGTARLEEAVTAYREALKERTRKRVPLHWATTQNNLGNALVRLGERESNTARLEEAVTVYREALKEFTRERVPLDWAMTQNNLGTTLAMLGERESSPVRLEEAVAAYRVALKERTRERVPLHWAMTQNNLGDALRVLGERESGTVRLEEAVAVFREALAVFREARAEYYIVIAERNLARAERLLLERTADSD